MLFAARESAVTKKPRLRLTMRRSSSVSPLGFFQSEMSRDMLISCGIQWLAQVARYFSQAHLYLNGTSWLTSVLPLMMRLSATLTRWAAASPLPCRLAACCGAAGVGSAASPNTPVAARAGWAAGAAGCPPAAGAGDCAGLTARLSSSQLSMNEFSGGGVDYWQASHSSKPGSPGLMVQTAPRTSGSGKTGAAAAATAVAVPALTAFSSPPRPVDFSALVAPSVRR